MSILATPRRVSITATVLDDAPEVTTIRDVEQAVRRALEREGFDVGTLDVRLLPIPERTV